MGNVKVKSLEDLRNAEIKKNLGKLYDKLDSDTGEVLEKGLYTLKASRINAGDTTSVALAEIELNIRKLEDRNRKAKLGELDEEFEAKQRKKIIGLKAQNDFTGAEIADKVNLPFIKRVLINMVSAKIQREIRAAAFTYDLASDKLTIAGHDALELAGWMGDKAKAYDASRLVEVEEAVQVA